MTPIRKGEATQRERTVHKNALRQSIEVRKGRKDHVMLLAQK